jgi:hypothetical protein
VGAAHQRACQGLREAHINSLEQSGGGPTLEYVAVHQDKVWDVRAKVSAVRREGLRVFEAAKGRLVGPEGRSFTFESQVNRQWELLGPRVA